MNVYFKPKNQEDYEFIFNNMNSYFPDPYKNVPQLITHSFVDVLDLVLQSYVDQKK